MIVLYGPAAAPFTEKVVRALRLKKLDFSLEEPTAAEDYRRWSPETGLLPVIDLDGERIADSTQILLHIEQRFPEPPLLSAEPRTRAAQRGLEDWVDESFIFYWLRWQRVRPEGPNLLPLRAATTGTKEPRPKGVNLRSWIARRRASAERHPEAQRLGRELAARLADLERLLAERPFFYATRISMADLAVYAMLRNLATDSIPGAAASLQRHAKLLEFMRRVENETGGP